MVKQLPTMGKHTHTHVENGLSTVHLLSPNKASSTETGLYSIELLAKEVIWKSPSNKQVRMLPRQHQVSGIKAKLLKITPTQLIEH